MERRKGFQVWNPALYQQNVYGPSRACHGQPRTIPACSGIRTLPGVPLSGMKSPLFYYEPRVGLAYDIFGTGKTVLRAGFAVFHYQISTQVADAATGPQGAFTFQSAGTQTGYDRDRFGRLQDSCRIQWRQFQNGATVYGLLPGDNKTPLTMDYNVTVSQALALAVGVGSLLRRQQEPERMD